MTILSEMAGMLPDDFKEMAVLELLPKAVPHEGHLDVPGEAFEDFLLEYVSMALERDGFLNPGMEAFVGIAATETGQLLLYALTCTFLLSVAGGLS
jgi:hypothetical protein